MDSPIGVFDSGLGGLTVAKQILARLPYESLAFVGDEIHVPYGERPLDQIHSFALGMCDFLIRQNAKLIVMACNISSAVALKSCRQIFLDVPVIGVIEAGMRAALKVSGTDPIGVLATTGTVNTKAYTTEALQLRPGTQVFEQACSRFVPLVEAGAWDSPEAENAAREYIQPLIAQGCRTLILGCTHYPYLTDAIRRAAGEDVHIVDPAEETAIEAANILNDTGSANQPHAETVHAYYTTAGTERFERLGSTFLGRPICVEQITWEVDLRAITCQEKTAEVTIKSAP